MKTAFAMKSKLFLMVLLMNAVLTHAQLSDSLRNELKKVSDELYGQKNSNFMIVDAILDGQIKSDVHYAFSCDSIVIINNKHLAPALEKRYIGKLNQMGSPNSKTTRFSREGTVTLKELFDSSSFFRQSFDRNPNFLIRKQLIPLLTEDLLLDTTTSYTVFYDSSGLYLNNVRLKDNTAAKYIQLIQSLGYYPHSKRDNLQFSGNKTH
jgi:hypothetical protein